MSELVGEVVGLVLAPSGNDGSLAVVELPAAGAGET